MLKITAIVCLMLIGSTLWAASLSCDSCGSECAAACGTRHFRSCCFNYLRKKRGPDTMKLWTPNTQEMKSDISGAFQKSKHPFYIMEVVPESWNDLVSNDFRPYPDEEKLQVVYDA